MADHFSGPRALADPASDITDVFAFPSPVYWLGSHPHRPDLCLHPPRISRPAELRGTRG